MSAELALVIISLALSVATFGITLTLLYRDNRRYAKRADLVELQDHVTSELGRLQYSISQTYRYVEAVDVNTGANGHRVLHRKVYRDGGPVR